MDLYQPYLSEARLIQDGSPFVSCVIVRTEGSTPRKAGTRMTISGDGKVHGTIGGGSIEAEVIREARQMLGKNQTLLKTFKLEHDLEMMCGGMVEVFMESCGAQPRLCIFGAGHVGQATAKLATGLGFRVIIMDERKGLLDSLSLDQTGLIHGDYLQLAQSLDVDDQTYILITTHDHAYDESILGLVIGSDAAWLGMIASKRKAARVRENLIAQQGIAPEQLDKVDMPVGIPIACQTPAEIAVSIVAKLIDVRNTR